MHANLLWPTELDRLDEQKRYHKCERGAHPTPLNRIHLAKKTGTETEATWINTSATRSWFMRPTLMQAKYPPPNLPQPVPSAW